MEITLKNIWAKTDPFQSIETHSILAGITAQTIWDKMLPLVCRYSWSSFCPVSGYR